MAKKTKSSKSTKIAPRSIRRLFPQVKTIIDAKQPVNIEVKKSDCKEAEPLNPRECALAKASKRQFHADGAVIGISSSYIIKGTKAIRFKTTMPIQREIVSFDRHSDFEPGSYRLIPQSPSLRLNTKHKSKTSGKHKATRKIHKTGRGIRLLATKE